MVELPGALLSIVTETADPVSETIELEITPKRNWRVVTQADTNGDVRIALTRSRKKWRQDTPQITTE